MEYKYDKEAVKNVHINKCILNIPTDTLLIAGLVSKEPEIQDAAANGIIAALEALDKNR